MAKESPKTFNKAPWVAERRVLKNMIQVTEQNRKRAIVLGRILYIFEPLGLKFLYRGNFTVDPHFIKGKYLYPRKPWDGGGHFQVTFTKDMDYSDWANSNKTIIQNFIKDGYLYINPNDPILTFVKQE